MKPTKPDHPLSDPKTWLDRYGNYLYAFALSRVRDPIVAEEVVQETFLAALGARSQFKKQSSEKTWFTGILKHKIIDHFRKTSREKKHFQSDLSESSMETFFNNKGKWHEKPSRWADDPHELVKQKEFMAVLYFCLSQLSKRQSEVFTRREMDGLSTDEICKLYDITATNCWVILHRARSLLRHCVEKNWFEESRK